MPLKLDARARGLDPFSCKVEQLRVAMLAHAASVTLVIDRTFRTNTKAEEGGVGCKNAILVGRRGRAGRPAGAEGAAGGATGVTLASEACQARDADRVAAAGVPAADESGSHGRSGC
jgi:hypothetical protein